MSTAPFINFDFIAFQIKKNSLSAFFLIKLFKALNFPPNEVSTLLHI